MAFGGFSPLPLRLGGTEEDGWSPEQQSRFCADLLAAKRALPFARVAYNDLGVLTAYRGRNGTGVLSDAAPTVVVNTTGDVTLTWPTSYTDSVGVEHTISITGARATPNTTGAYIATVAQAERNVVRVLTVDYSDSATDVAVSVRVYGNFDGAIGDYDGATDKMASIREGLRPYAFLWYKELQAARGSAYTTKRSTLVHAENLAMARMCGWLNRQAEKLPANSLPATADEKLEYWVKVLGIRTSASDERWRIRQRCAAKYQASVGPTATAIDNALATLLGDSFVQTHRQVGTTLASPPAITYWPGVNPGPSSHDLGDGAWLSERAHLVVEVQQSSLDLSQFLRLVNVDMFELLDRMLPAWVTFDWALAPLADGFLLDISQLDFHGLTP